jgi:hypothetical protein
MMLHAFHANKIISKQANKQTSKQANKQTNKTPTDVQTPKHPHASDAFFVLLASKCFGEAVGGHLCRRDMLNLDDSVLDRFADEVVTYIDVFSAGVRYGVLRQSNSALTVGKEISWLGVAVRIAQLRE